MTLENITIQSSDNANIIALLAYLEVMGNIGHNTDVFINFDGDGKARLNVTFSTEEENNEYRKIKKLIIETINNGSKFRSSKKERVADIEFNF